MALDCNTCDNKQNAVSDGHCSEFHHIPAIDACAMHTGARAKTAAPATPAAKPSGEFLWLRQAHTSVQEKTKPLLS